MQTQESLKKLQLIQSEKKRKKSAQINKLQSEAEKLEMLQEEKEKKILQEIELKEKKEVIF